jgi:hypothetical protein
MLRQYNWHCNSYSAQRRSVKKNKKNHKFSYLVQQMRPPFAYGCGMYALFCLKALAVMLHRNINFRLYITPMIGATALVPLHLFFQNSPYDWAVLKGNRNMAIIRY